MAIRPQTGIDTVLFAPQGLTDAATATANWDTRGGDYASIRILYAAEETTDATANVLSVLHSDDTVVSNFATITANLAPDLTSSREERYEIDLRGKKRYLRLSITSGTGTGSNQTFAAIGTLWRNDVGPANTTAMGDDGVTIVS